MTTFHNFARRLETNWAKRVVKPILEVKSASDNNTLYVWFIHIKLLKRYNKKHNNSKCTKWIIKTKIRQIGSKVRPTT